MQQATIDKLRRTLDWIADYRAGNIGVKNLVDSLDGTLLSMEEPLPKEFVSKWEDAATNLEMIYALGKEGILKDEMMKEIDALQALISDFIMNQKDKPAD
jgi:hypothetical protein